MGSTQRFRPKGAPSHNSMWPGWALSHKRPSVTPVGLIPYPVGQNSVHCSQGNRRSCCMLLLLSFHRTETMKSFLCIQRQNKQTKTNRLKQISVTFRLQFLHWCGYKQGDETEGVTMKFKSWKKQVRITESQCEFGKIWQESPDSSLADFGHKGYQSVNIHRGTLPLIPAAWCVPVSKLEGVAWVGEGWGMFLWWRNTWLPAELSPEVSSQAQLPL